MEASLALSQPNELPSARRTRIVLVCAGALLVALVLAAVLWRSWGPGQVPGASPRVVARLKDLPARPEDIEAHGGQAPSLLGPDAARARNAAVPFASGPVVGARGFAFKGSEEDRAQARECLAAAVLYEAGDDAVGQAAVAQVVLNRVRHPAFPATVCGVVYQGSQRSTGCQFTFTCDGSLRRRMPDAAWGRARAVADRALAGWVDKAVGLATHYHTDWVYPYWSPQLSKLARVGTHLFFGWPGGWGGAGAFRRDYRGGEAGAAAIAAILPEVAASRVDPELGAGILGLPQAPARLPAGMGKVPLYGNRLRLTGSDGRSFGLLTPAGVTSAGLVNAALALCAEPGPCRVNAWSNEDDVPGAYPIPVGARGTMVFEFVRDAGGMGAPRFDCDRFPNRDPRRCLVVSREEATDVLSGVRFKTR